MCGDREGRFRFGPSHVSETDEREHEGHDEEHHHHDGHHRGVETGGGGEVLGGGSVAVEQSCSHHRASTRSGSRGPGRSIAESRMPGDCRQRVSGDECWPEAGGCSVSCRPEEATSDPPLSMLRDSAHDGRGNVRHFRGRDRRGRRGRRRRWGRQVNGDGTLWEPCETHRARSDLDAAQGWQAGITASLSPTYRPSGRPSVREWLPARPASKGSTTSNTTDGLE